MLHLGLWAAPGSRCWWDNAEQWGGGECRRKGMLLREGALSQWELGHQSQFLVAPSYLGYPSDESDDQFFPLKYKLWGVPGSESLVQNPWFRIRLTMQGTMLRSPVWKDPACHGVTKPMGHNSWVCALEPTSRNYWAHICNYWSLKPIYSNEDTQCSQK